MFSTIFPSKNTDFDNHPWVKAFVEVWSQVEKSQHIIGVKKKKKSKTGCIKESKKKSFTLPTSPLPQGGHSLVPRDIFLVVNSPMGKVRASEWVSGFLNGVGYFERNSFLSYAVLCLFTQSCLTFCDPMDYSLPGSSVYGDSPGKKTKVGFHAFLQRIFPTQGSNWGVLHCRQILYQLSYQRSSYLPHPEYWSILNTDFWILKYSEYWRRVTFLS